MSGDGRLTHNSGSSFGGSAFRPENILSPRALNYGLTYTVEEASTVEPTMKSTSVMSGDGRLRHNSGSSFGGPAFRSENIESPRVLKNGLTYTGGEVSTAEPTMTPTVEGARLCPPRFGIFRPMKFFACIVLTLIFGDN
mmetsp:Transcript_28428/g.43735  ORF Transcript_28428/g.43735 Transcript_28428/m.43735 type:complete len:139 (-) Transcript_28428:11-427(-)